MSPSRGTAAAATPALPTEKRPGRAGAGGRLSEMLLGGGAAMLAIAGSLAALQIVYQRPNVLPAFFVAAAVCPLIILRPAWIIPIFLGFVWTSIGRDYLGGLSPVNYGSYILLPLAVWHALSTRRDAARSALTIAGLVALPLLATSLAAGFGPPSDFFKDLAFLAIVALCLRGADVERVVVALVVTGIALSIGAVYSVRVHPTSLFPLDQTDVIPGHIDTSVPRAAGPFGESNFFALSLAVLVPLALHLISRGGWRMRLGGVAVPILIAGIYSTGSRGGALAAGIGIVALAFASGDSRARWGALLAVIAGAILLLVFSAQASSSAGRTVGGRTTENEIGLAMFGDHPLTGVGPGRYPFLYRDYARRIGNDPRYDREPHSLPIQIAAEEGIVGLLGWVGAVVVAFRLARVRRVWDQRVGRAIILSLLTYMAGSAFLHGSELRLLWILVGLLLVLCTTTRDVQTRGASA